MKSRIYIGTAPVACAPEGTWRNAHLLKPYERWKVRVLCIVDAIRGLNTGRILTDVYRGTRMIVEHLLELGHREIAYFSQPFAKVQKHGRHDGYYDALKAAGVPAQPDLIVETGVTPADAHERTREFVARGVRFTAAVYANDYMAVGGLRALRDCGLRVPEDVSVTGFDDVDWARFCEVPLTTVRFPTREIGERAVFELMQYLNREPEEEGARMCDLMLSPTLVVRRSTAPPKR